jgi:hypothetical protein
VEYFVIITGLALAIIFGLILRPRLFHDLAKLVSGPWRIPGLPLRLISPCIKVWKVRILPIAAILVGIFTTAAKAALLFLALNQVVSYVKPLVFNDDADGPKSEYVDQKNYEFWMDAIESDLNLRGIRLKELSDKFDYLYANLEEENERLRQELDSIKYSCSLPSGAFDPQNAHDNSLIISDRHKGNEDMDTEPGYLSSSLLTSNEFTPETIDLFASNGYKSLEPIITPDGRDAEEGLATATNRKPVKPFSPHIKLSWDQILDKFIRFSKALDIEVKKETQPVQK